MRRLRLSTGPAALFGAFLLAALLALLPLRLVLGVADAGAAGLSARRVDGSIWAGSLSEARLGGLALGDLDARVSPWRLLLGQLSVALDGNGTARPLHGRVTMRRHGFGVEELTAGLAAGSLFQPLPVTGLDLDAVSVRFEDGACREAEGRVRATLGPGPAGIALPPEIAGAVRCEGGALLVPLAGQAGAESVTLRVEGDGRYRAEFTLPAADPATVEQLTRLGFQPAGNGYRLVAEGRF